MTKRRQFILFTCFLSLLAAASLTMPLYGQATEPPPPTDRPLQPIQRPSAEPTAYDACAADPQTPTAGHNVVADLDYAEHVVTVNQRTHFVNRTGDELGQIVFLVAPNRWQDVFTLADVASNAITLTHQLEADRLTVDLPQPLFPGCQIELLMRYRLQVPLIGADVNASKGFFGYTARQMNLGHWLVTLAPYQAGEWQTRPFYLVGEQEMLDPADWHVTLNTLDTNNQLSVAGPGRITPLEAGRWRFEHLRARDFALSISDRFEISADVTASGLQVELYSFPESQAGGAAPAALQAATRSLGMFEDLFGPYPHARLVIVEGDFPDGMEFSGLSFVGSGWFQRYPGTPASYLVLITVHEVAHQWWYGTVGNDPALHPWLDEALSTYSEYIYIEEYHPELRDWWWSFRVASFSPQGDVDSRVYDFVAPRDYINAVYLRGVLMLRDLREALGTEAFFQLLTDYAREGEGRIAGPDLFWSLLSPEQLTQAQAVRSRYFRAP